MSKNIFIDCRQVLFIQRETKSLNSKDSFEQSLKNSHVDPLFVKSLKLLNGNQIHFLIISKTDLQKDFYSQILQRDLKDFQNEVKVHYISVGKQNEYLNNLIENEYKNLNKNHLVLVSHKQYEFQSQKITRVLFSGYAQNSQKKYTYEKNSYAQKKVDYHISSLAQLEHGLHFIEERAKRNNEKVVTVGYYFVQKKQANLIESRALLASFPYQFVPLDFLNVYEEIPFNVDIVLHKLQDFYKDLEIPEKVPSVQKLDQNFANFFVKFPQVKNLDKMTYYDILNNRITFQEFIEKCIKIDNGLNEFLKKYPHIQTKVPKIVIFDPTTEKMDDLIKNNHFDYPLLIKPAAACSTQLSHFMAIILHEKGLLKAIQTTPFNSLQIIIQELVNHDGKIYKLYQVGDFTEKQVRASIPNIDPSKYQQDEGIWYFDSQKSFFSQLPIPCEQKLKDTTFELQNDVVDEIGKMIQRQLNIHLFGFDIVKKTQTDNYYIIDINYFPGFKDFKDVDKKFFELYYQTLQKQ